MSNPGGVDFNVSPHFDDYDEDKKFVRMLFRPGRAVQARELTQLQTILQKQIQRFGSYFFREGSIVDGCEQGLDLNLPYVKLQENYNAVEVDVNDFLNQTVIGANTGVQAKVGLVTDVDGTDPKTLFINYTGSGTLVLSVNVASASMTAGNTIIQTSSGATAQIQYWNTALSKIYVANVSGTFTSSNVATTVDTNGNIIPINVVSTSDKRASKEFENSETIFTVEATPSYANAAISQATSYTDANDVTYTRGSKITVGDGIMYVADHFIKNSTQTLILDKYSNLPSYKVGVVPSKTVVEYLEDGTLVDNAQGTPNYQAPGADRFKINTILTKIGLTEETSETEFIALSEIDNGLLRKKKSFALESKLEEAISKRTYEESGDYTLSNPKINVREHLLQGANGGRYSTLDGGNTNLLLVEVDPFIAYVKGFRNEFISKQSISLTKGIDTQTINQSKSQVNFGNYIEVNEVLGSWDIMEVTSVDLYDTAFTTLTSKRYSLPPASGSKVGTAKVRSIEYVSGVPGAPSAVFRMYLFDIVMTSGNFESVRGVYDPNASPTGVQRLADIVLDSSGRAVLQEVSYNTSIFRLPYDAVKTLRDQNNNIETAYTFKKEFSVSFNTSGQATISSGDNNETFSGTGALSSSQKNENYFVIVENSNNAVSTTTLPGTVTVSAGTTTVTGNSTFTQFSSRLSVGDLITIGAETHRVASIASDSSLTLATSHTAGASGVTYTKNFPAGAYVNLSGNGGQNAARSVTVQTGATSIVIDLKEATSIGFTAKVVATMNRVNAREMKKILNANNTVNINPTTHATGNTGPYSLGQADVYQILGIYQSANFSTAATTSDTNVTSNYIFDNGQRDNTYEHGTITPKVGVTQTGRLLAVYDYFSHDTTQGVGYMSVDSYPIDDVNDSSTTIDTAQIPVYTSTTTGAVYNLRNCVDFRLRKSANTTSTNPIDSGLYQIPVGGLHVPKPVSDFDADMSIYKGKVSKLFLNSQGEFGIIDGSPGYPNPQIPSSIPGTLDLAVISVPPYPSQPKDIVLEPQKNRRYTMKDIGKIEDRVNRLEYYASLNLLEKQATDISILDDNGLSRFKNGILVDPFTGYNIGDVNNSTLKSSISRKDKFATAQINLNQIPLKINSSLSSGITRTEDNKVMLTYAHEVFSDNPYASGYLNLAQSLTYDYTGIMSIHPSTDNWMDTTNYPLKTLVIDLEGNSDNWRTISNAWETEYDSWQSRWVGVPVQQDAGSSKSTVGRIYETSADKQYDIITSSVAVGPTESQSQARIVDVSVSHYMRARDYIFKASGLKPNSRLYAFFDGVDVTAYCDKIALASGKTIQNVFDLYDKDGNVATDASVYSVITSGTIYADSTGSVIGIFSLPSEKFTVGQREFKVIDDSQNRESVATTSAKNTVISQGLSLISTSSQINTRPLNANFTSQVEKTLVNRSAITRDPLAQSFIVDNSTYQYGVFLTKIDLFFKSKSTTSTKKVYVQIREMENGLPTRKIIGDSTTSVESSAITVSATGSIATTFTFKNPIYLLPGIEYCFSVIPEGNSDEFELWIAELGGIDVSSGALQRRIDKQPAAGTLFTSSTDFTWSVRQTQDLKYKMYVADFSSTTSGTVYLQNANVSSALTYSAFVPNAATLKPDKTSVTYNARVYDSSSTASDYFVVDGFERVQLPDQKSILTSSTESSSSIKSFTLRGNLSTQNKYITPFIDLERAQTILIDYDINNSTSNTLSGSAAVSSSSNVVVGTSTSFLTEVSGGEYLSLGGVYRKVISVANNTHLTVLDNFTSAASGVSISRQNEENPNGPYASNSRYITRRVELPDTFEANDLNVFVDVNRPAGTNIKVYYKVLSSADNDTFDDKFYQEMTIEGTPSINDDGTTFVEEKYIVPSTIKTGGTILLNGTSNTASTTTLIGTSTRYLEELRIGDTIAVNGDTRVVTTIANNTFLTVDSNFSTTATGKQVYKQLYNSLIYVTPDNRSYAGYKYFAIKVVFLSDNAALAPKIKRLRAIALT